MGYEIQYSYHEEISKGEYNKDEIKTKTVKIGGPYEEVTLELLAGKVMAQLARRNILVVDVEIYEYTKKRISFKEAPDGILIKNRKFSFDEGAVVASQELMVTESEPEQEPGQQNSQQLLTQLLSNPAVVAALQGNKKPQIPGIRAEGGVNHTNNQRAIRYEIFNPVDRIFLNDAKARKLAFTLGKKYPIFSERKAANFNVGMIYQTLDDNGNRQAMSDKFFTPEVGGLERDFEQEEFRPAASSVNKADGLDWSSFSDEPVPEIHR